LFTEDLDRRNNTRSRFLMAQAALVRGEESAGIELLRQILSNNPNHELAVDLLDEIACEQTLRAASAPEYR
jgi:cytochrome c-type biogenesis protein CcmH/NrfG